MTKGFYEIEVAIPDELARVTAELVVLSYIREDGSNGYVVAADGDMPLTTFLGLTILAQDEIKAWGIGA